jgi:death-on-curing protein
MNQLSDAIRDEYQRWSTALAPIPDLPTHCINLDEILRAHFLLCDYFLKQGEAIATVGPRDTTLLGSAVSRQVTGIGDTLKWGEPLDVVSTLFFGLTKNHPFYDGNKRTALLVALYHLLKIGRIPDAKEKDFEQLVVRTAANELPSYSYYQDVARRYHSESDARVKCISHVFKRLTRKRDSRFYTVTFNELEGILRSFGFHFHNHAGNYVDVVRPAIVRTGLLGLRTRTELRRIITIGYPGGGKEVSAKEIGRIRRACGLTDENGYDSQVFFKDASPLNSLIARYHGPLTRLKDK